MGIKVKNKVEKIGKKGGRIKNNIYIYIKQKAKTK